MFSEQRFLPSFLGLLMVLAIAPARVQAQLPPSRYALVVGVREYPSSEKLPNLPYTEADAHTIGKTLTVSGYDVTLMTQTAAQGVGKQRFAPNASFIRKQFAGLVGTPFLKKNDCLLVVLQGHGIQLPSKTNAEKNTFYFCPADASIDNLKFSEDVTPGHNLIRVQELYDTLNKSKAGVKLLIADACRNDPNRADNFRSANSQTRPAVPVPPGGMAAFFSCSAGQRAVEDGTLKHGVFSYYLIEGLSGKADFDQDKEITITELQAYVSKRVYDYVRKEYSRTQLPELTGTVQGFAPILTVAKNATVTVPATLTPMPPLKPLSELISNSKLRGATKAGELWADNSLETKFRWCPPGNFVMGSSEQEKNRNSNERESLVILTKGFWLAQHEVRQGEWQRIMGTTPWRNKEYMKEGGQFPASYLTWSDAVAFCEKLTEQERKAGRLPIDWEYALPTEAQWEYACRAGTSTRYSFGDDPNGTQLKQYAWFSINANDANEKYAHEIGQKKPNAWNFHDMHGNLAEWCRDYYQENLPGKRDPEVTQSPEGRGSRVTRGGSWLEDPQHCRSASRVSWGPDFRFYTVGFRISIQPVK